MRLAMILAMIWAVLPVMAVAQEWQTLDGDAITTALLSRQVLYEDGTQQSFATDGITYYGDTIGYWRVQGDQYCSQWPPSDRWSCYDVEQNGIDIRFVAGDGSISLGRYVDLQ
jgi:hypothetical protein